MAYRADRLPTRFPVGTKFVIEGRRREKGTMQVFSRFIEFPDGTKLKLPKRPINHKPLAEKPVGRKLPQKSAPARRRTRIARARVH